MKLADEHYRYRIYIIHIPFICYQDNVVIDTSKKHLEQWQSFPGKGFALTANQNVNTLLIYFKQLNNQ